MTPTKFLIGQILIVFAIMVLGVWASTQWAAVQLAHQPQLGPAWFSLGRLPVYGPWALFGWECRLRLCDGRCHHNRSALR